MKKLSMYLILVLTLVMCRSSDLFAQEKFEGKIIIEMTGWNSGELSYYVKGNKIRMNVEGKQRNSDIIVDKDKMKEYVLMTQMNRYIEVPLSNPALQKFSNSTYLNKGTYKTNNFKNTGETKVISGFKCQKWIYNDRDVKLNVWLTKELCSFTFFNNPTMKVNEPLWKKEIENTGYFPIKIVQIEKTGHSMTIMEVKSAERMNLEDSYFQPPSDFEKMDMPDMSAIENLMKKKH
jgi:Domain of unknown function (DUF4412)